MTEIEIQVYSDDGSLRSPFRYIMWLAMNSDILLVSRPTFYILHVDIYKTWRVPVKYEPSKLSDQTQCSPCPCHSLTDF